MSSAQLNASAAELVAAASSYNEQYKHRSNNLHVHAALNPSNQQSHYHTDVSSPPSPLSTASYPSLANTTKSLSVPASDQLSYQQIQFLEKGNGQLSNGSYGGGASSMADSASLGTSYNGGGATPSSALNSDSKKKLGHREVKHGVVLYKKVSTDELKKSIQFGIVHFLNEQNRRQMDRDLIMQDFNVVETVMFPKAGTSENPPHSYNDFKLKVYAPYGFRYELNQRFLH